MSIRNVSYHALLFLACFNTLLVKEGVEKVNYRKPGFFGKFWELQKVMWRTNAGLVESHAWDSRPGAWPFLKRGINFWGKEHRQIYLIGNPVIWWSSTAAIAIYILFKGVAILRWQRGYRDYEVENFRRFDYEIGTAVLGWALHYFPFYLMQRQLFLHHYFPALFFAIVAVCQIFDFVTHRIQTFGLGGKPALAWIAATIFLSLSIVAFMLLQPLAYGNKWTKDQCKQVKLFTGWDWDCNIFFDELKQYDEFSASSISPDGPQPTGSQAVAKEVKKGKKDLTLEERMAKGAPPAKDDTTGSPAKPIAEQIIGNIVREEQKVEYRDQDGNILNEEQVKALEGQVEFKTKYETRIKTLDADGIEIPGAYRVIGESEEEVLDQNILQVAPQGVNEETEKGAEVVEPRDQPPQVDVKPELVKAEVPEEVLMDAKPASEAESETASSVGEETEIEMETQ